ncbi:MAG: hypothetical protein HWN79_06440 [Candidatus Lokiarchaeota archaeon]|nr:hypothetical protein [Candidatus Lokiarchaeota archaeon]
MNHEIGLEEIEKKAWRTTFDDGIFDIYFGILIASFAPSISLTEILPFPLNVLLGPIMLGFGLAFFILSKKYLIKPRIGAVKFGRKRKIKKLRTMVVLSVSVVLLLILFLFNLSNNEGNFNLPYLLEGLLFLTVPLCFVAYFLQFTRLYVYAVILGSGFFLADISSLIIPIPFNFLFSYLSLGGIIMLVGITYLIRFMKKYPLPEEAKNNG